MHKTLLITCTACLFLSCKEEVDHNCDTIHLTPELSYTPKGWAISIEEFQSKISKYTSCQWSPPEELEPFKISFSFDEPIQISENTPYFSSDSGTEGPFDYISSCFTKAILPTEITFHKDDTSFSTLVDFTVSYDKIYGSPSFILDSSFSAGEFPASATRAYINGNPESSDSLLNPIFKVSIAEGDDYFIEKSIICTIPEE